MFSRYTFFSILISGIISYSCGSGTGDQEPGYQLLILDTLSIGFQGEIHAGDFRDGRGVIYNYRSGEYLTFDSAGSVLARNRIPAQGENGLFYVNALEFTDEGEILAQSINGEIGLLDQQLQLKEKIIMPFPNGSIELKRNVSTLQKWRDQLLLFYPGRDSKSPYQMGYYRDNHLLEKLDLSTGKSSPFLKLSPESQYQKNLHFEPPTALISVSGDQLYFAFNKEPLVHLYDLSGQGALQASVALEAKKFVQVEGQEIPLGNDGSVLAEGEITGLFALDNGFAVTYFEGLENLPNQPNTSPPGQQLKIHDEKNGWTGSVELPIELLFVLNFEGPDLPFYGIINPVFTNNSTNTVKILKFQIQPIPKS
ncbi:hypothetical protein SAMN04488057_10697 [Cyclobacterium lianum]|uniref:Phytase-like domain-containing protein n=2 Tax=Cyclobacterium lianum TaxID=388280 RepID=A0A1M7NV54_9BACT|nr:hypothetical protein SAMN04488057_10697 [Cyclobacterium lianum]